MSNAGQQKKNSVKKTATPSVKKSNGGAKVAPKTIAVAKVALKPVKATIKPTPPKLGSKTPATVPVKYTKAIMVPKGKTIAELVQGIDSSENLAKLYDWKKTISEKAQAQWTLDVKKIEDKRAPVEYSIRLMTGDKDPSKNQPVKVYSILLKMQSVNFTGVGILGKASLNTQRKYKAIGLAVYYEDVLDLNPNLVEDANEYLRLMSLAKDRVAALIYDNDILYEKYIKSKVQNRIAEDPKLWKGKNGSRENREMRRIMILGIRSSMNTFDEGPDHKVLEKPTVKFFRNVFNNEKFSTFGKGVNTNDRDTKDQDDEEMPEVKKGKKFLPLQKPKKLTAASISQIDTISTLAGGRITDPKVTQQIIDDAKANGYSRTVLRITGPDGKYITVQGRENDMMFCPLKSGDYAKLLSVINIGILTNGIAYMKLRLDNRGIMLMRQGEPEEARAVIKDEAPEALAFDPRLCFASKVSSEENKHDEDDDEGEQDGNTKVKENKKPLLPNNPQTSGKRKQPEVEEGNEKEGEEQEEGEEGEEGEENEEGEEGEEGEEEEGNEEGENENEKEDEEGDDEEGTQEEGENKDEQEPVVEPPQQEDEVESPRKRIRLTKKGGEAIILHKDNGVEPEIDPDFNSTVEPMVEDPAV